MTSEDDYLFSLKWRHLLRFKSINPNFSVAPCQIHLHFVKALILGFRRACNVQLRPLPIQNGGLIKKDAKLSGVFVFQLEGVKLSGTNCK